MDKMTTEFTLINGKRVQITYRVVHNIIHEPLGIISFKLEGKYVDYNELRPCISDHYINELDEIVNQIARLNNAVLAERLN